MFLFVHALPRSEPKGEGRTPNGQPSERDLIQARVAAARRVYLQRVYLRRGGRVMRRLRRRRRAMARISQ